MDAITAGFITAYGTGLTQGATGKPSVFTVSTKDAGAGALSMSIEGPCRTEVFKIYQTITNVAWMNVYNRFM